MPKSSVKRSSDVLRDAHGIQAVYASEVPSRHRRSIESLTEIWPLVKKVGAIRVREGWRVHAKTLANIVISWERMVESGLRGR